MILALSLIGAHVQSITKQPLPNTLLDLLFIANGKNLVISTPTAVGREILFLQNLAFVKRLNQRSLPAGRDDSSSFAVLQRPLKVNAHDTQLLKL
jgi:hypothetical protein